MKKIFSILLVIILFCLCLLLLDLGDSKIEPENKFTGKNEIKVINKNNNAPNSVAETQKKGRRISSRQEDITEDTGVDLSAIKREREYQAVQAIMLGMSMLENYEGNGKCLIIHHPITGEQGKKEIKRIKDAFSMGLGRKINEIRTVAIKAVDILDEETLEEALMEMKASDFNRVIEANSDCDMIITMVSLPFSNQELNRIDALKLIPDESDKNRLIRDPNSKYPAFGVYNGYVGNLSAHIEQGTIKAMSLWKPNPTIDEEPLPNETEMAFNKRYLIISPDNLGESKEKYPKLFPKPKPGPQEE